MERSSAFREALEEGGVISVDTRYKQKGEGVVTKLASAAMYLLILVSISCVLAEGWGQPFRYMFFPYFVSVTALALLLLELALWARKLVRSRRSELSLQGRQRPQPIDVDVSSGEKVWLLLGLPSNYNNRLARIYAWLVFLAGLSWLVGIIWAIPVFVALFIFFEHKKRLLLSLVLASSSWVLARGVFEGLLDLQVPMGRIFL